MRARKAVVVVAGVYAATSVGLRLFTRAANWVARWQRMHSRTDGVTAVSAAYLGLLGDRTPYPAPWNEHPWDEPGWYGERAAKFSAPDGMRFVGPPHWVAQARSRWGADNPGAN